MGLTRPRAYQIFDLDYKQSVRVVTVTNITLSGGAPNQVDGVNLTLKDRILVTGQSTASQNGLYYVTTLGTGSNGTWQRSVDGNETGEIEAGMIIMVTEGTVYADTQWKLTTNDPIVIGSTALTFVQNYSANSISAGTSNVSVQSNSNVSIAVAGTNLAVFSTGTQNITANIIPTANVTYNLGNATNRFKDIYLSNNSIYLGNVTLSATGTDLAVNGAAVITSAGGSTLSLTGNITGGNLLTSGIISATGNITSGNVTATNLTGTLLTASQTNITSVGTLGSLSVTGNVQGGNLRTAGLISATGNVTVGNVTTAGLISATGNITGGNINATGGTFTGNVAFGNIFVGGYYWANGVVFAGGGGGGGTPGGANTQIQFNDNGVFGGSAGLTFNKTTNAVATTGTLSVTGNIDGGNLRTAGLISATGQITASQFNGSGAGLTSIPGGNVTGTVATATTAGTVTTAAQPNITSVGTLSSLSVTGNTTSGNLLTGGLISATGAITGGGNITGGNVLTGGLISATGAITGAALTGTSLSVSTGNITGGNLVISGAITDSGPLTIQTTASNGNISLTPNGTGIVTVSTAASITGNITGGNLLTGGLISATGQVTASQFNGSGAGLTSIPGGNVTGTVASATSATTSTSTVTPTFSGDSASGGNIQQRKDSGFYENSGANTATGWPVNSNNWQHMISCTHANDANYYALQLAATFFDQGLYYRSTNGSGATAWSTVALHGTTPAFSGITNSGSNGVGNIGSASTYFNTVFARATSAQYADLAEMYVADADYPPGTVVEFGGEQEVTITTVSHSTAVAGIVSTNPSYLMNSTQTGEHVLPIALTGRVPCRVQGPVHKGDVLVSSSVPGVAQRIGVNWQPGCVVGKSMENILDNSIQTIEVAVGRL